MKQGKRLKEVSRSFLKKRTKKLLFLRRSQDRVHCPDLFASDRNKSFLVLFFKKERSFFCFKTISGGYQFGPKLQPSSSCSISFLPAPAYRCFGRRWIEPAGILKRKQAQIFEVSHYMDNNPGRTKKGASRGHLLVSTIATRAMLQNVAEA